MGWRKLTDSLPHFMTLSYISKHDAEEEGKGNHSEDSRVDLLVSWIPICIHQLLGYLRETIASNVCWRWRVGK